jgi:hypothetical protein
MVYPGIQGALPAAGEQIILAVRLPANSNIHTTVNAEVEATLAVLPKPLRERARCSLKIELCD